MSTMKTMSGNDTDSDMLGRHGDLTSAYTSSYARHSVPVDDTQQNAAGVGMGGSGIDDSLTTSDYNGSDMGSDTSGYGMGIAGEAPMVASTGGGDDTSDSNRTAGGKAVG